MAKADKSFSRRAVFLRILRYIRPHLPLPIDRICHDPQLIQQTYDIGREAALAQIGRIKAFCAQ